jgi:hypothetical protein
MTYTKPDGTIEISVSPCCCPPGTIKSKGSVHTKGFTHWWKTWMFSPELSLWNKIKHQPYEVQLLAQEVKTAAEFDHTMRAASQA